MKVTGRRRLPSATRHGRRLRGEAAGRRNASRSRERTARERRNRNIAPIVNIEDDGTWSEVNSTDRDNGNNDVIVNGNAEMDVIINGGVENVGNGSCIDLTASGDEEYIDLTSPTGNRNLAPVVIGSTNSSPARSQRRQRRRRSTRRTGRTGRPNEDNSARATTSTSTVETSNSISDSDDESVMELPDPALASYAYQAEVELNSSSNTSVTTSPGQRKITCPVCMDDDKQIRRSGRQLNSTVCGHIFCNHCIRTAIQTQHTCPACRKHLTLRQIHPIFI